MIDAERLRGELADLISIPSVTGDEAAVQDRLAVMLSDIEGVDVDRFDGDIDVLSAHPRFPGMEVERTRLPVVVGRWDSGRPGPVRMLVAHVDVVPPGEPDTWTTPAFEPTIRDGRMYGRGACDMKAGVVSALGALRSIAESADPPAGSVLLALVPGEEDGGSGAFAVIAAGYSADACIITEPTSLEVVVAHGGAITFTLDIPGRAAHASMRREGVSAIENLAHLQAALRVDEQARNDAETDERMQAIGLPYPTIIGQVHGGNWASTVPDRVEAHGRYGVTIHQDAAGAADDLRRAVARACADHPFLRDHPADVTIWGGRFDSAAVPSTHPLPTGLARAAALVTGSEPALVGAPYGADMRLFVQEAGIPTVMYGPGSARVAHAADEYVPLDEVTICAEVLDRWIRDGAT